MFKKCVQHVCSLWTNRALSVGDHPQNRSCTQCLNNKTMQNSQILPISSILFAPIFPQLKKHAAHLFQQLFSPLSTLTITTTTKYKIIER